MHEKIVLKSFERTVNFAIVSVLKNDFFFFRILPAFNNYKLCVEHVILKFRTQGRVSPTVPVGEVKVLGGDLELGPLSPVRLDADVGAVEAADPAVLGHV